MFCIPIEDVKTQSMSEISFMDLFWNKAKDFSYSQKTLEVTIEESDTIQVGY
jgi:hypothetical protein